MTIFLPLTITIEHRQVEGTNVLDLYAGHLNQKFNEGLLIVQDGFNYEGDIMVNQNVKLVSLSDLLELVRDFDRTL